MPWLTVCSKCIGSKGGRELTSTLYLLGNRKHSAIGQPVTVSPLRFSGLAKVNLTPKKRLIFMLFCDENSTETRHKINKTSEHTMMVTNLSNRVRRLLPTGQVF